MRLHHRTLLTLIGLLIGWPSWSASYETRIQPLSAMGEAGEKDVLWQFKLDSGRGAERWTQIKVPSCWEQQGFGAYYYGTQSRDKPDDDPSIPKERAQYRRSFTVPADWSGQQVRIVFEGVMTDTTVRVNGRSAGPTHQGGFYRFDYDITDLIRPGDNELEVDVSKESTNHSVNRAERRGDYWTFGGIYRPVWLEIRPTRHIDWTAIDARADGSFYANVHVSGGNLAGSVVRAQILDLQGKEIGPPMNARVDASGQRAVVQGVLEHARAWTAETPNLYRIRFDLLGAGESETIHRKEERFGFRTLVVRPGDGVYLNGRKIVLKGINRHSFNPESGRTITRAQSYADARLIKEANMNAVRMSHYPPDPHFLEAADELGLYVLDELAGWQGAYDTQTATRLIGQIVRRDVNHPSILFWDNGNEGGWNREVDGEFDRWDPQQRRVLHPWALHSGINTDHYENYDSTAKLSAGPDIFMPTEFLHGLYDGGIGAGLHDYWDVMSKSPTVAGGFFWAFADEGVMRTDQNNRIDTMGNAAPDGIVGPHGEKEGSYFTVKEIWSPVQINDLRLSNGSLSMHIENHYAFTNLSELQLRWRALRMPPASRASAEVQTIDSGVLAGPSLAPGEQRTWSFPLNVSSSFDTLHLEAIDPFGRSLWTWSLSNSSPHAQSASPAIDAAVKTTEQAVVVRSPPFELSFDRQSGSLRHIKKNGRIIPLTNGPELIAYRRVQRSFEKISSHSALIEFRTVENPSDGVFATATYDGPLRRVSWSREGDQLTMSYELAYEGSADILGIGFALPEEQVLSKRWVGMGPYRVWQNRLEGGVFGVHETTYNDAIPGQTYAYPEFKGYFGSWRWLSLKTKSGDVIIENASDVPYFGLFKPQGGVQPVLDLPDVGVAFLSVIPAMGTKFTLPDVLGPQSLTPHVSGVQSGRVTFRFEAKR